MTDLSERRNIVLGITGSIAAYKSAELARLLMSRGYNVKTVLTRSAQEFVTPLTFESITGNPVVTDFWDGSENSGIEHIDVADWADALVIAPATADIIAKLAAGFADSPLLAVALATRAPILVAPAMNVNMFEHQKTKENIEILKSRGIQFVDPEEGALACGWKGTGRLANPWEIFHNVRRVLSTSDFAGKHVLITTGPTQEPIDPVRFISNRSSGKMGVALAQEVFRRGARVTLVHGPVKVKIPSDVSAVPVITATQMYDAVLSRAFSTDNPPDIIIMAAAVADYRPTESSDSKIKKGDFKKSVSLSMNQDILMELGKRRADNRRPVLVGFAVETGELDELLDEARAKLKNKKADMIVGNFAEDAFDLDTNRVWLVDRTGRQEEVSTSFKSRVANRILDAVLRL